MLLALSVIAFVCSAALGLAIVFANSMSDNPSASLSQIPTFVGLAIAAVLFAGWWFGW